MLWTNMDMLNLATKIKIWIDEKIAQLTHPQTYGGSKVQNDFFANQVTDSDSSLKNSN